MAKQRGPGAVVGPLAGMRAPQRVSAPPSSGLAVAPLWPDPGERSPGRPFFSPRAGMTAMPARRRAVWNSDHGHVLDACKDSLKKLQLDYLDLYLIHFPLTTRHTGVGTTSSALGDDGVLDIDSTISLKTTWHAMEELVSMGLVRSIGISSGANVISYNLALWQQYNLQSLAEKYGKTPAQLVLRWGLQRNTVVIPMTSKAQ
ncbi:NADP-dependent D-sorbitol-6-phosphate dehydrogenase-like [Miscanthus floridulus]|uniref:NADP-dependent D-sorbitol-6-phosphate dehydrogenase-like n=1 Tax=Miscanthus floridulus TaxID=154761 RepID=UPI00345AEA3D